MKTVGLASIYYSNDDGTISREKLNDMETIHTSHGNLLYSKYILPSQSQISITMLKHRDISQSINHIIK